VHVYFCIWIEAVFVIPTNDSSLYDRTCSFSIIWMGHVPQFSLAYHAHRHPAVFSQSGRKSFGKNSGRFISAFIFEIECSAGMYSTLEQRTEWRTWTWSDSKSDRVRGIGFNYSTKIYGFYS